MRPTFFAALLFTPAAALLAQGPAAPGTPHAVLCPGLSGFEIGQKRTVVYDSISRSSPAPSALGPDLSLLYTPRDRRYQVRVTFDAQTPDARVTALHYSFDPAPGLLPGLRERYGPESPGGGDPATHVWDVSSCGVRIRYRVQLSDEKTPIREELWIDRFPAKGLKAPDPAGR
jgi:hypothetical protein